VPTLTVYVERRTRQLSELGHRIEWAMIGKQLAHGACTRCQQPIVIQPSDGGYTAVTKLSDSPCEGTVSTKG
jgi:hypothetical protein